MSYHGKQPRGKFANRKQDVSFSGPLSPTTPDKPPPVNAPGPAPPPPPALSGAYNCRQLLEALKAIQDVVQCYSCHKPLATARTCENGHGICWNCKNRCNRLCPLCKGAILDTKQVMLNDIIKLLPRICKYSNKGCASVVLPNDNDHETFCRFRHTDCRLLSCGWRGMAKDLLMHLEKLHGQEVIRTAAKNSILMEFTTRENRDGLAVIVAYNNIIWQHIKIRDYRLMQFYQYVPMEKPTRRFTVEVSFHTQEMNYASTTPVHVDTFDPSNLFKDHETFCLPKKVALSFNKFHSGVHYSFKIIEKCL